MAKNLPAKEGDTGLIPGQEDPMEMVMQPIPVFLLGNIPWAEEPAGQ